MSLKTTIAVPFQQQGTDRLGEGEFVVALSMDRDWFTPNQVKRLVDIAQSRGLLTTREGELVVDFDPAEVQIPEGFSPAESILRDQSTFERALESIVDAGNSKQEAVAAINERQRSLEITIEAAAILYAHEHGIQTERLAQEVRRDLLETPE